MSRTGDSSGGGQPVALVTGAGSGIGREVSRQLAERGWALALAGRRREALEETARLVRTPTLVVPTDVGDALAARRMVESAVARFGRLDALINNAGYAPMVPVDRHTPELLRDVFNINAVGPAAAVAGAWETFRRQGGARVVFVSSYATRDPFPGFFGYASAKAAVNMLARTTAGEGRAIDVKAFAVAPGAVETSMLRSIIPADVLPTRRTLAPEAVARVIVECAVGERDHENGTVIYLPSP